MYMSALYKCKMKPEESFPKQLARSLASSVKFAMELLTKKAAEYGKLSEEPGLIVIPYIKIPGSNNVYLFL